MKWFTWCFILLFAISSGCVVRPSGNDKAEDSVGVAEMKADGTIILQLGSATFNGALTEGHFEYPPNHPDYEKLLKHIQPIAPGKIVKVRPFPPAMQPQL